MAGAGVRKPAQIRGIMGTERKPQQECGRNLMCSRLRRRPEPNDLPDPCQPAEGHHACKRLSRSKGVETGDGERKHFTLEESEKSETKCVAVDREEPQCSGSPSVFPTVGPRASAIRANT